MREDELEFSSKATEAKKKYEKNIFVSIIRNIESNHNHIDFERLSFEQRKHSIVLISYLWEENFRRGSFCDGRFYNFNPYIQNLL